MATVKNTQVHLTHWFRQTGQKRHVNMSRAWRWQAQFSRLGVFLYHRNTGAQNLYGLKLSLGLWLMDFILVDLSAAEATF